MRLVAIVGLVALTLGGCEPNRPRPRTVGIACDALLAEHAQRESDNGDVYGADEARCKHDCAVTHGNSNAIGLVHRGGCFCSNVFGSENRVEPLDKQLLCDLLTSAQEQMP